ncbi:MAG: ROK family protein [Sphingobacteriaceae bacterium]|nr:ROK family protein [Sphingobacteriaceae bacterium]
MKFKSLLESSTDSSLSVQKLHFSKQQIINRLLTLGNATILELSNELQMSIPTITKVINELLEINAVIDLGKIVNSGGRRPSLYSVNETCAYFLGVEVKRDDFISIGIQNIKSEIVGIEIEIPFVLVNTEESINAFCDKINSFIATSGVNKDLIIGACVNFSGRINSKEGYSHNILYNENKPLAEVLADKLALKVWIENDTRAMAFGEYCHGAVDEEQNILFLNYSWGVAIGIITGGKLYYGKSGYSGEFGHFNLFDNDLTCHCGKMGCLETEISGWSLIEQLNQAVKEGKKTTIPLNDKNQCTNHQSIIAGVLNNEDNLCIELITNQSEKIGRYLSGLLNIFNPDLLVIGGDFAKLGDYVLLPIQAALKKHTLGLLNKDVKLKKSVLGSKAGVIGACYIVKEKMLHSFVNG